RRRTSILASDFSMLLLCRLQGRQQILGDEKTVGLAHPVGDRPSDQGAVFSGVKVDIARSPKLAGAGLDVLFLVRLGEVVYLLGGVGLELLRSHFTHAAHPHVQLAKAAALIVVDAEDVPVFVVGLVWVLVEVGEEVIIRQLPVARRVEQLKKTRSSIVWIGLFAFVLGVEGAAAWR